MIYYCGHCGKYFVEEDIKTINVCLEREFGVSDLFKSRHYQKMDVCPYCESEEIDEAYLDDQEICDLLNK